MDIFFANTRPGKIVTHGDIRFELPILYFRDDLFMLYFTANAKKIRAITPSNKLHPVIMPNGKAIIAVGAFNYINTTIGPYGEVPVGIPVVYGRKPFPFTGIILALLESRYPGFGILVQHLPVTNKIARDAGRKEWGYTKFVADMHFNITPEYMECQMDEADQHILDIRVARKGFYVKDTKPLVTFSVKDRKLIKTVIPQKGTKRLSLSTKGSFLNFGNHPMSQSVRDLEISPKPFMAAYYPERAAILPSGVIIEDDAMPFEGYIGQDREAKHTTEYTGQER